MKISVFNTPILNALLRAMAIGGLRLSGWKITPPARLDPPYVVIGAPHTSNWDFLLMLAAIFISRMDVKWMGKNSLFPPVLGSVMRWLGGIPIDRDRSQDVVLQMAREFRENETLTLVIAPEGTRKKVSQWKSGFYYIAFKAKVPIMMTVIDAGLKEVRFAGTFMPTGNYQQDLPKILEHYSHARGIVPKNQP
tara:strand:- start:4536 stop:5114 length:579 start_codon:yes stop_codon:yes gene_type:complete